MKRILYLICFVLAMSTIAQAQEVHVVSKKVQKQLDYNRGDELEIQAEKATINISTWDKNHISLELKLISKHKKKETAREELDLLKYEVTKSGAKHLIRNFFEASNKFVKVKGNLLSEFTLKVPQGCQIILTNTYGRLSLSNLNSDMTAFLKFVDCQIINGSGDLDIKSSFGSILLDRFEGKLQAKLERSDIELIQFEGIANLKTNYGQVDIQEGIFQSLAVNGTRTKINFSTNRLENYNYDVKTTFASLRVPKLIGSDLILDDELQQLTKTFKTSNANVKLHTTYGSVNLRQLFSASSK